jgi:hypothetical protein
MARFILANQATAAKRRVYFFLVDLTDGLTPETGEGGGQPEISTNGGAFTSTGIGTLTHIGNGHYYADLTQAAVATAGDVIVTRYSSANTAEGLGDQVYVISLDLEVDTPEAVWDEVLSAATHNVANSAGRRLRQISSPVTYEGTAQGPGTGNNQIQLEAAASAVDGTYDPSVVAIVGGTGSGQSRYILEYAGATRTATVGRDWKTNPDATSEYIIFSNPGHEHVNEGLAQGGGASTITLNALASSSNDAYKGQTVFIRSGTGADQAGRVTAYNGTTKVATVTPAWPAATPDTTSGYVMIPLTYQDAPYAGSGGSGARTITITINDAGASPVAGVAVDIYDSGNTVFQQRLTTNVNGQVVFNLDDATYTVRQFKAQYTPDNAAETLVVTADAGVTYTGTVWTAPSASDPSLCTVWGYLLDASGAAIVNAEVRFWADVQIASGDNQIGVKSLSVVTDANGYFEQDLIRSVTVYVDIKQAGYAAEAKTVPNLASQSFATW